MNVTRIRQAFAGFGGVRLLLVLAAGALLGACGGGGGGDSGSPGSAQARFGDYSKGLGANEVIGVAFGAPVNRNSLAFSGTLAPIAEQSTLDWRDDNRGVEIIPDGDEFWTIGAGQTLAVSATTSDGGSQRASEEFKVILKFEDPQSEGDDFTLLEPVIVGQQNDTASGTNVFNAPLGTPGYLPSDNWLYFPDSGNSRILGLEGLPSQNVSTGFFEVSDANLTSPRSVAAVNGGPLLVADTENHRIVQFNPAPGPGNSVSLNVVFGNGTEGCSALQLKSPESVFVTPNGAMIVADTGNNRVLIWSNGIPPTPDTEPSAIIGQSDLGEANNCEPNRGSDPSDNTLWSPKGVWSNDDYLVVTDSGNHRALIWNQLPTTSEQRADVILGQDLATDNEPSSTLEEWQNSPFRSPPLNLLQGPTSVTSNGQQLFISDEDYKRTLVWNVIPSTNNATAIGAITAGTSGNENSTIRENYRPDGLLLVKDRLILGEPGNNRYLIFQSF